MKYIEMKSTHQGLFLEIEIGFVCNYRCSYCPPYLSSGNIWLPFEDLIYFIEFAKPSHVLLVGGEPTYYPHIDELLEFLKENNIVIDITSNGSRPLDWWKKHKDKFDITTLSYHLEFSNLEKFIEKLQYLTEDKIVTVNVSMIVDRFDECLEAGYKIAETQNTFVSLKALTNINTARLYDYTDEQLKVMSQVLRPKVKTTHNKHSIDFYGITEDGQTVMQRAQTLISNKENVYKGWRCNKGIDYMKLIANGDLFKATCELGTKPYGNIKDYNLILPNESSICQREYCYCLTDLKTINKKRS